jgi:hypothetical protein
MADILRDDVQKALAMKHAFRDLPSVGLLAVKILIVLAFMGSGTGAFIYQNF